MRVFWGPGEYGKVKGNLIDRNYKNDSKCLWIMTYNISGIDNKLKHKEPIKRGGQR
jgi:hypothetical protein